VTLKYLRSFERHKCEHRDLCRDAQTTRQIHGCIKTTKLLNASVTYLQVVKV